MSEDADFLFALEMQNRWNAQQSEDDNTDCEEINMKPPPPSKKPLNIKRSNPHSNLDEEFLNRTHNLVHPQWETLDPTPDVFSLFGAFDSKFFQGRLKCVSLEWSKRMYSCAGICYLRRNRLGMDVTIRLSEPLLKLRSRKDLVETMLHEMIHAYCFVLNIREGNGGHGPHFKKIMYAINKVAGTNITVYHTFHDEVNVYKQHWWRCNGSCQNRAPFFGYVKRTCNRAPGPNDQWWAAHLGSCGGTFMKIKEPEKKRKENMAIKAKDKSVAGSDLRKFFNPLNSKSNNTGAGQKKVNGMNCHNKDVFKGPVKSNGGGTMLLNPKTVRNITTNAKSPTNSIAQAFPPSSYPGLSTDPFNATTTSNNRRNGPLVSPGGNLRNVMSFSDLTAAGSGTAVKKNNSRNYSMSGQGYSLTSSSNANADKSPKNADGQVNRNHLREIWAKRFGNYAADDSDKNKDDSKSVGGTKRRRSSTDADPALNNAKKWVVVDDDIMLKDQEVETIALSSDDDDDGAKQSIDLNESIPKVSRSQPFTGDERQNAIKQEILDDTLDLKDEDIILIDDDYNDEEDTQKSTADLEDTSIIDEFFGEDTLLKEFKRENDVMPSGSRHMFHAGQDIITCPICQEKMRRDVFEDHLNGCTGIAIKIKPPTHALKKLAAVSRESRPARRKLPSAQTTREILRNAGYSEQDLLNITNRISDDEEDDQIQITNGSSNLNSPSPTHTTLVDLDSSGNDDDNTRRHRQRNIFKTTRQCPVCAQDIEETEINEHLDECLQGRRKK